jgi:hypothetical protein
VVLGLLQQLVGFALLPTQNPVGDLVSVPFNSISTMATA